ncbi:hypothetical protein LCGC14_1042710 [marine sediment metagenome]|uniref:Uncharacterized protein n=2 Tax=root TaxID=1 RepID=A0A831QKG0_9FLAO|nr:hypothetical protein [Pricia antarctica]
MKKLLTFLSIAALVASCTSESVENDFRESIVPEKPTSETPETPETPEPTVTDTVGAPGTVIEEEIVPMGSFSYQGQTPSQTSKVPTCKDKEPATVLFEITDAEGNLLQRESPVTLSDGLWVSQQDSLPIGRYTLTGTTLMSADGEPLYALPNENEPDFTDYVEASNPSASPTLEQLNSGILPSEMEIGQNPVVISGTALCYIPSTLPVDGGFGPGIGTKELQTLVVYATGQEDNLEDPIYIDDDNPSAGISGYYQKGCLDIIYIVVDGRRVIERYTFSGSYIRYPFTVPTDYNFMVVYGVNEDVSVNAVQQFSFTRENPYDPAIHGALIFDKCNPQETE